MKFEIVRVSNGFEIVDKQKFKLVQELLDYLEKVKCDLVITKHPTKSKGYQIIIYDDYME